MYAPIMCKHFRGAPLVVMVAASLASCQSEARKATTPPPEAEQVISNSLKDLYMAASTAAPQSAAQHKLILRMADQASNAKELLLTMRAAHGVFPAETGPAMVPAERELRTKVTAKMMKVATVDQLIDFAKQYSVDHDHARAYIDRMFVLANEKADARTWHQIRVAASRLKLGDMEQQALARAEQSAGR